MNQKAELLALLDRTREAIEAGDCPALVVLTPMSNFWRTRCAAVYDAADHEKLVAAQQTFLDEMRTIRPIAGPQDVRFDL